MTAHDRIRGLTRDILGDLAILAGEDVGPGAGSWQDVAGTCACNLRVLAGLLDELRAGATHHGGGRFPVERPLVFPGLVDLLHAELDRLAPVWQCPDCGEGEGESR